MLIWEVLLNRNKNITEINTPEALSPSKRAKFKENNREGIYSTEVKTQKLKFKTVPEKELTKIKNQIRERSRVEQKKERLIYGIFLIFGLILIIGILIWMN